MRKGPRPRIVIFAILTTLTIITWIGFDLWAAFHKAVPVELDEAITRQFSPTLDQQLIGEIRERLYFSDDQVKALGPQIRQAKTTAKETPLPEATPSGVSP